jgi:hypothetical protein
MSGFSIEHVKARLIELGYQGEPTPEILRQCGWIPDDPLANVDLSGPIRTKEQLLDDLALLKAEMEANSTPQQIIDGVLKVAGTVLKFI